MRSGEIWNAYSYTVLDYEGSGLQHKDKEGVVEIAAVKIQGGILTRKSYYSLLDPEIEIPKFISNIHGITNVDVQGKPHFREIKESFRDFFSGDVLIAHNARIELGMIRREIPDYKPLIFLDTLKLSRFINSTLQSHKLEMLINHFGLLHKIKAESVGHIRDNTFHSAMFDALATAYLFLKLISNKKDISLRELNTICGISMRDEPVQKSFW